VYIPLLRLNQLKNQSVLHALTLRIKRLDLKAVRPPLSTVDVKNAWRCTFALLQTYVFTMLSHKVNFASRVSTAMLSDYRACFLNKIAVTRHLTATLIRAAIAYLAYESLTRKSKWPLVTTRNVIIFRPVSRNLCYDTISSNRRSNHVMKILIKNMTYQFFIAKRSRATDQFRNCLTSSSTSSLVGLYSNPLKHSGNHMYHLL
jgi:hypothetical protein